MISEKISEFLIFGILFCFHKLPQKKFKIIGKSKLIKKNYSFAYQNTVTTNPNSAHFTIFFSVRAGKRKPETGDR